MTEEWADRIALSIVGLGVALLMITIFLAPSVSTPEPEPTEAPCTEADGACIGWSELHYPGIEWRTD